MVIEPVMMHGLGDKLAQRWGTHFVKSSKNWNYVWPLVVCPLWLFKSALLITVVRGKVGSHPWLPVTRSLCGLE